MLRARTGSSRDKKRKGEENRIYQPPLSMAGLYDFKDSSRPAMPRSYEDLIKRGQECRGIFRAGKAKSRRLAGGKLRDFNAAGAEKNRQDVLFLSGISIITACCLVAFYGTVILTTVCEIVILTVGCGL